MSRPNLPREQILTLVHESKIRDLLPENGPDRLEASGVVALPNGYYVVFDNLQKVARIAPDFVRQARTGRLRRVRDVELDEEGFEDLVYDPHNRRFHLLVEGTRTGDNEFMAQLVECDADFEHPVVRTLPFPFVSKEKDFNKGFEGVAMVRQDGIDYVLALCEAPRQGATPRQGQIEVFAREGEEWHLAGSLALPDTVQFADYAAIDVRDNRVAVVSQEDAKLWVGTLRERGFGFVDAGTIYQFPPKRTDEGDERVVYCNIEGVAWVGDKRIVTVSDAKKREQHDRCKCKAQSIQIFDL